MRARAFTASPIVFPSPLCIARNSRLLSSSYANAVTRLHPTEWASGTAAGAAAALMAANGWDSSEMFTERARLQALLAGPTFGQPLEWTL